MGFPTSPTNGQLYENANGVVYQYISAGNKWVIVSKGIRGPFVITYNQTEDSLDFNYM